MRKFFLEKVRVDENYILLTIMAFISFPIILLLIKDFNSVLIFFAGAIWGPFIINGIKFYWAELKREGVIK